MAPCSWKESSPRFANAPDDSKAQRKADRADSNAEDAEAYAAWAIDDAVLARQDARMVCAGGVPAEQPTSEPPSTGQRSTSPPPEAPVLPTASGGVRKGVPFCRT